MTSLSGRGDVPTGEAPLTRREKWRKAIDNPEDFAHRRENECLVLADEEIAAVRESIEAEWRTKIEALAAAWDRESAMTVTERDSIATSRRVAMQGCAATLRALGSVESQTTEGE